MSESVSTPAAPAVPAAPATTPAARVAAASPAAATPAGDKPLSLQGGLEILTRRRREARAAGGADPGRTRATPAATTPATTPAATTPAATTPAATAGTYIETAATDGG